MKVLQDYAKRLRVAKEVLESHVGGPIILPKVVEAMPGRDETDLIIEKSKHCAQRFRHAPLETQTSRKCGSILTGLRAQQSLNNDQCPKTITDANNVLSNHPFDNYKSTKRTKAKRYNRDDDEKSEPEDNKDEEEITLSFAQLEGKCCCCGKPGHRCP